MSKKIKVRLFLFSILPNHSITFYVFCHWLRFKVFLKVEFILLRNGLLSFPYSLLCAILLKLKQQLFVQSQISLHLYERIIKVEPWKFDIFYLTVSNIHGLEVLLGEDRLATLVLLDYLNFLYFSCSFIQRSRFKDQIYKAIPKFVIFLCSM